MTEVNSKIENPSAKKGRILRSQAEGPLPTIPNESYPSFVLNRVTKLTAEVALVDATSGESFSYDDLRHMILSLYTGLRNSGVKHGDVVAIISTNHLEIPALMYSIMLMGATCTPINPLLTSEELVHMLGTSEPKWAIVHEELVPKVEESLRMMDSRTIKEMWVLGSNRQAKWSSFHELKKEPLPCLTIPRFDPTTRAALMLFSSGTTGLPKGVMLSHRNLLAVCTNILYFIEQSPDTETNIFQSVLLMLPLCHIFGFLMMSHTFITGGKLVLLNKFSSQKYFEAIPKYQISISPLTPHIVEYLVNSHDMSKHDVPHFQKFTTASAYLKASTIAKVVEKSKRQIFQAYGLTETTGTVCISQESKPESVGKLILFNEAKIIDVKTGEPLPEEIEGELCVRGPYVMMGYFKNPKATSEIIDSDGWLHTGDMAYYDKDDFIYITGRIKDLIKVKGFQVSPDELEAVIIQVKGVKEVAVAGVKHNRFGEAPKAWVVPEGNAILNKEEIMKYVADRVSPFKQLHGGVEIVESLPRSFMNKVLRRRLGKSQAKPHSKL